MIVDRVWKFNLSVSPHWRFCSVAALPHFCRQHNYRVTIGHYVSFQSCVLMMTATMGDTVEADQPSMHQVFATEVR